MISRPLIVASTVLATMLLGAPNAMATSGAGATGGLKASTSCSAVLAASVDPTAVTVSGTVRCAADADLKLSTSAEVGSSSVDTNTAVRAAANVDVSIKVTITVPGCTGASAELIDVSSGATVAATAG